MGGNIHHFFYILGYLLFFPKYMKNKIGILENDIYLFPIVNSVICEVYSFGMFWYVLEGRAAHSIGEKK